MQVNFTLAPPRQRDVMGDCTGPLLLCPAPARARLNVRSYAQAVIFAGSRLYAGSFIARPNGNPWMLLFPLMQRSLPRPVARS